MKSDKIGFIQVFTTMSNKREAEKITGVLIGRNLAACCQIVGPITSVYWWRGKKEKSKEWLLIIKALAKNYKKIEKEIKKVHSYELPEIIALPIIEGSKEYLKWLSYYTDKHR